MKNLPSLLQRLFDAPRKNFVKNLRESLMGRFVGEQKYLEGQLYFLAPEMPREEFKNRLREALLAEMPKKEKKTWQGIRPVFSSFRVVTSLSFASILIFSLAFFGISPIGSASGTTTFSSFSGKVFVSGDEIIGDSVSLFPSQVVSTGDNSFATLSFFEDSLVRMDKNTEITIDVLQPHKLRADLGEVHITLQKGRIWMRNASAHEQYSRFVIAGGTYDVILDFGGAAEISVEKQGLVVRVWDRIARVFSQEGDEFLLSQNEKFTHFLGNEKRESILADEEKDAWTLYNLQEDHAFFDTFVLQKIEKQTAQNTSTMEKVKEVFSGAFSHSDDMRALEDFFFDTLALFANGETQDTTAFLHDFEEKIHALAEKSPEDAEAFLTSAEKSLAFVLPDSPFFSIKDRVTALKSDISQTLLATEKARTQKLWEASILASAGHMVVAKSIVQESADSLGSGTDEITPAILEERESQMVALSQIEEQAELSDLAENIQDELVQNTKKALTRPGFPETQSSQTTTEKAQAVIRKVKKYEKKIGQENTLTAQLSEIENTAENISLVIEIKNRLPEDFQEIAQRKLLDILATEKTKR